MGAGRNRAQIQDGTPELSSILDVLEETEPTERLERLRRLRIQLYRDDAGDEPISSAVPGPRWLAFETERNGKRYCLHDGRWYLMDQNYAGKLNIQARAIFDRRPNINLPDWPAGYDEAAYNELAAQTLGGTLLDRRLIYTDLHRRGIEACDVLTEDGALVHIKTIETSSPASHLIAQALVSADALLHDDQARQRLRERVQENGGDPTTVPTPIQTVILGIARKGRPITTSADLLTFTQVALVRNVTALQAIKNVYD